ncbi:hypothetical protein F5B22DRAFT_640677 [Xylaria bambusicola]|uniref:uncharacterized protein n=1 Tax=Xylaria bambusicola TaxID=326684 RepID=UPI00200883F9|nr:uncharacterized protein F5B22DRAFT_640677 [Xylaria bambusicola]KAI0502734.1 hypothetical protein F5B22DRAFT_640677 [Xylaria bambusicola]
MSPSPMSSKEAHELVAVVGMGCRWPGGVNSPRQMWSFLREQRSGFCSFNSMSTPRCFSAEGFYHMDSGRPGTMATEGAFLIDGDPRLFDHAFFSITGREAETLDPSQRKLLEVVYEAFENAGETWASVAGSNTGVFVGNFALDHWIIQARDWEYAKPHSTTGASPSILANRISHVFDLRGPSVAVDTACSSSMYAVHLAVSAIRNGDCDSAIVAASNWIADPSLQIALDKLGALSPTSRCHTFDASADGYARGEGFAALYLKQLPVALASESPIRAVIRGTAVNANGRAGGITRPSAGGQEAVIRKAYANAGVPFSETTYFECHGTGTPAGDPIYPDADSPDPLFIGSIKTNMGHAGGASALAAIMKVVLSMEAGEIPPSIGIEVLHPSIDLTGAGVEVVRQVIAWPKHRLRRASINSFGFGGANGHAILESYDAQTYPNSEPNSGSRNHDAEVINHSQPYNGYRILNGNENEAQDQDVVHRPIINVPSMIRATDATTREFVLLPFSAHSESSLWLNIEALSRDISQYSLANVVYTLAAKRPVLPYRICRVVDRGNPQLDLLNVAFVFTGQGAQWHGMGVQLFEYRVFRVAIEYLDDIIKSLPMPPPTWSITSVLKCDYDSDLIHTPLISQTVCTAIQIGLVDLLASWGICPTAVAGHSSGEIAAVYASGRITAADAIIAAYLRGRAVAHNNRSGAMLAVGLGPDQLQKLEYLNDEDLNNGQMRIAAINSPGSVTISGDAMAIEALAKRLAVDGVFHRLLRTGGIAYHSHHMVDLGQEYEDSLSSCYLHVRQSGMVDEKQKYLCVPWVSSVTPDKDPPSTIAGSAAYWRANLESPVRFSDAILSLLHLEGDHGPINLLVEIGPHSALKGPLEQVIKSVHPREIMYAGSTLRRGEDACKSMLQLAGALYCMNAKVNLVTVNAVDFQNSGMDQDKSNHQGALVHGHIVVDLPPYQYTYGPVNYYECRASKEFRLRKAPRHVLLGSKIPGVAKLRPQWRNVLRVKDLPWLGDHRLFPDVVFPAAGYIALAIEAVLRIYEESPEPRPKTTGYTLRNVSIKTALRLPEDDHGIEIILSLDVPDDVPMAPPSWASFSISSVGQSGVDSTESMWTEHCTGIVKIELGTVHDKIEKIETTSMDGRIADVRSWYKAFNTIGLGYGPTFRTLIALDSTAGKIQGGDSRYALHPTALDGALQLGLIACYGGSVEATTTAFVPVNFSRIYIKNVIHNGDRNSAMVAAQGELRGLRGAYINQLQMLDGNDEVILNIERLRCVSYISEAHFRNQRICSAFRAPFARTVWKPDFRTLNYQSCRALFPPPDENIQRLNTIKKLDRLACAILVDAPLAQEISGDIGHFTAWIKRSVEETTNHLMVDAKQLEPQDRHKAISRLHSETKEIAESRIAKCLYDDMDDILSKRHTGVDIMIHGDDGTNLLMELYQRGLFMTSAYPQLWRVLDGLTHANPHMRILEIGAGTGGATRVAMNALTSLNGIKRYREYVFTDISPGFLAAAKSSMANFRDISYSMLDIEADPATQGYQPLYDIVLASQALHATTSILQTLKNCRKLLRPEGKLVLVENTTEDSPIVGLILGTLTGYWHGIPDGRVNSPFMSLEAWDRVLKEAGFSGAELVLDDYPRPDNVTTTLVSTLLEIESMWRNENVSKALGSVEAHLLHSPEHSPLILGQLCQELERRGINPLPAPLDRAMSVVSPDACVVVFLVGKEDFLVDIEGRYLATFQHLARTAATLVCLTFCGLMKGLNPEGALIPGLMRTIGTENPGGRFVSIDVSDEDSDASTYDSAGLVRCIADQLFLQNDEPYDREDEERNYNPEIKDHEYVWQDGCLWVSRAMPDDTIQSFSEATSGKNHERAEGYSLQPLEAQGPVRAAFSTPGILSSLYFRPYSELLALIPSDYIEVKVTAVGVNWKDLAVSSGRFDADNLSSEYSGIVTAVGADAASLFCAGDRVYGMGGGHFGNYTRVPAAFAQKLDTKYDLVEVATMPLVYMTAVYAFDYVARLRRGHRVLIQSATGGLGLAAIQLARAKGAEVFAMVGTAEKAEFLVREMKLPESHVIAVSSGDGVSALDRTLTRMTPDSRGFDVILGTARGDVLDASIQALAPLGHFVDVGRTDVQDSQALAMGSFEKCASFSSFDLSLVLKANQELGRELMQTVHSYSRDGLIGPVHPFTATDVSKLDQVLLKFSKGTHVGKLVVTFQDPQTLVRMPSSPSQPQFRFDSVACYIVVGGLGGLGRSILRWMCERGARNLVILSRRSIKASSSAAQSLVSRLTGRGVNIRPVECDVSNRSQVTRLIQNIASNSSTVQIRGIIHAAVSYLDISFNKLTVSRWRNSLSAKVQGTQNLHEATVSLNIPLDFFVMITSLESIYALATQSGYTAANAFQDAFARYRRRLGLPATSISFGFIKGIGDVGQDPITVDMFARNRALALSESEFLGRLEAAFLNDARDNKRLDDNGSDGDAFASRVGDPLSSSNILTCLDPGAMAAMEHDEAETEAGSLHHPSSAVPRWYSDARVSHIMRAFEDARREQRTGNSSATAQKGDDNSNRSSVWRVRAKFEAATAAGSLEERSRIVDSVTDAISAAIAELLFVDIANVNSAKTVADHGVDSLIAAELRNWLYQALGANINMQELLDTRTSIESLAGLIVDTALAGRLNVKGGKRGDEETPAPQF